MPDVSFTVGTRRYTLRCAPGQEEHLLQMAAALDARVQPLSAAARSLDDRQVLVMAAIALLDEMAAADRSAAGAADGGRAAAADGTAGVEAAELRRDNSALRDENAALREENAGLREWADDMAVRLAALSGSLGTLAE